MAYFVRLGFARWGVININRSISYSSSVSIRSRICPFCLSKHKQFVQQLNNISDNSVFRFGYTRKSSTYTRLSERSPVKSRKKWKIQKFVELIEVTDKGNAEAVERNARIKNSSATNTLKKLGVTTSNKKARAETTTANEVDFNTKELMTSEEITSNLDPNLLVGECDNELEATDLSLLETRSDALLVDMDCDLENFVDEATLLSNSPKPEEKIASDKSKKNNKKKSRIKKKQISEEKLAQLRKEYLISQTQKKLIPFLDVCVTSGKLNLADSCLKFYHEKYNNTEFPLDDVRFYNCVLEGWAANGNWDRFKKILSITPEPNLQTYVYAIECVYRGNKHSLLKNILDDINKKGFSINNILRECTFTGDQKETVIRAIRSVNPIFSPLKPEKPRGYVCNLLKSLNEDFPIERKYSQFGFGMTLTRLKEMAKKQMTIEKNNQLNVRSIEKKSTLSDRTLAWRKKLDDSEKIWRKALAKHFNQNLTSLKEESKIKRNKNTELYPYLSVLDPDVYVDLMFQEVANLAQLSEAYSPTLFALYRNLGNKIMERYSVFKKQKNGTLQKIEKLLEKYCEYFANPNLTSRYTARQYWELLEYEHSDGPDIVQVENQWPLHIVIGLGEFLYKSIVSNIKIDLSLFKHEYDNPKLVPAFFIIYRRHNVVKTRKEIKPHPALNKLYKFADRDNLLFQSTVMPMLCPPLPWSSVHSGGYLLSSAKIIRFPEPASHQRQHLELMDIQKLYPAFDSLNYLSECPWVINKPMLDLVIEVFNNKGSADLDIPQPVSECPSPPIVTGNLSKVEVAKRLREKNFLKQRKAEMYSLWCDMLYKLSIANQFRDQVLWLPHNMDFRGRVYPCPPHFNHLGSDVSRSLLLFAKGEPLGAEGLKWLKIHLVNLTGLKKRASLDVRLKYCDEILDDIMDSADKPLTGKGWWKKSDEPWQTLACCMELTKALRSPNIESYVCRFPVHQDGSCNGLQHYAALGRDQQGAEQVNLEPSQVPQDVYSGVAELVELERKKDALIGIKTAQVLDGFINRRVVKQPVMTTVYGVTRYGARLQIIRQLKDIPGFPKENIYQAASYLVSKTFFSLQKMFSATKEIQDWFTESASLISHICGKPVEWETPIGLPIIQPYFKDLTLGKSTAEFNLPNTRKQKNAFPPNYIHSLDSTHMMLTSLFCQRQGIVFVSVHDCFWTHAASIDKMNKICREQFVALHSEPLLETLSEFLVRKFILNENKSEDNLNVEKLNRVLAAVPEKGSFNLRQVLKSTYFFS